MRRRSSTKSSPCLVTLLLLGANRWTGRQLRRDKPCAIPEHLATVFARIGMKRLHFSPVISVSEAWSYFSLLKSNRHTCFSASTMNANPPSNATALNSPLERVSDFGKVPTKSTLPLARSIRINL